MVHELPLDNPRSGKTIQAVLRPVCTVPVDEATLEAMEIDDPLDLTGLYRGTPIGERHAMTTPAEPEMIFLYRLPILVEWCERGVALEDVVFDVLTHEIGHHLGMDEDAVLRMEARDDDFP